MWVFMNKMALLQNFYVTLELILTIFDSALCDRKRRKVTEKNDKIT